MNVIKFNTTEFEVNNFNKYTYFSDPTMTTTANCDIVVTNINDLLDLAEVTITSIQILHNGTLIYDLQNTSAKISNMNEFLNSDHMSTTINLIFDNV